MQETMFEETEEGTSCKTWVFLIRNTMTQGKRWLMFAAWSKEEAIACCDEKLKKQDTIEMIFERCE